MFSAPADEAPREPAPHATSAPAAPDAAGGENARVSVRLLLSAASAGSIIGRKGATIAEFETQSGARIQLSRPDECFPGTQDRLLLLVGTINAILTALHLLLTKLAADEPSSAALVKLVVPNACVGAVLGKEGATIRSYTEDSGAAIKVSSKNAQPPSVPDRVVTVSGALDQVLRATALVITRATEEPGYPTTIPRPYTYAAPQPSQFGAVFQPRAPPLGMVASVPVHGGGGGGGGGNTTVIVAVPDEHIGAIMCGDACTRAHANAHADARSVRAARDSGRAGATITEMQHVTGVTIKVSGRDDVVAHTNHRKITVSGAADGVAVAQFLISQRLSQSVLESSSRRGRA